MTWKYDLYIFGSTHVTSSPGATQTSHITGISVQLNSAAIQPNTIQTI